MRREKRSEILRARVTPSLRGEIEQALREEGSVITISDWLFEAAEARLALRSIRTAKQRIARRAGEL